MLAHLSASVFFVFPLLKLFSTPHMIFILITGRESIISFFLFFGVRQMVPLLRRLITMLHNINKSKYLKGKCNLPQVHS